jgi:hypothetical protein
MPQVHDDGGRLFVTVGEAGVNGGMVTDDATAAVVAHRLLTSLAVIAGTSAVLRDGWQDLAIADRISMLNRLEAMAVEVAQHLRGLATGRPELPA